MPVKEGNMGSYNQHRGQKYRFLLHFSPQCCDIIMSYIFPFFMCGSLLLKLSRLTEAHAFLFTVIIPAWSRGGRKKLLVGSFLSGCFCAVTLNNPVYRGGYTHTHTKRKNKTPNDIRSATAQYLVLLISFNCE